MKSVKYFLLATAIVLLAALGAGAMAQNKIGERLPPQPALEMVTVNAVEVTDGTLGIDDATKRETAFGYSFLGQTTGFLPGSFTLSMNCAQSAEVTQATETPGGFADGFNEVTGGTWTLPVYNAAIKGPYGYAGSLYGTIANGSIKWEKPGMSGDIYIDLNIGGGTGAWDGVGGSAIFVGTLTVDEKTGKKTLNGDLMFTIIRAEVL